MNTNAVRRKVIKGTLAAPVVLTVSSASASAMSSFGRCLRRGAGHDPDAPFFVKRTRVDNMFRKPVEVHELAFQGKGQGDFYLDPVSNVYINTRAPYRALDFGSRLPDGWQKTGVGKRWALVYFDERRAREYRHITLQRPHGYRPTTVSCYSSFRSAA